MKQESNIYSFLSKNSYLLPFAVISLTIGMLLLTLMPTDYIGENQLFSYDKIGHAILFGGWSLLVGLYLQIRHAIEVSPWTIFAIGVFFGILIEVLQYALPVNRHADPVDFFFDVIGCLIAVWLLKLILPEKSAQTMETEPS